MHFYLIKFIWKTEVRLGLYYARIEKIKNYKNIIRIVNFVMFLFIVYINTV